MEDFVKRIIKENEELQVKIDKLAKFIETKEFRDLSGIEKLYLRKQLQHMSSYASILRQRIKYYSK